MLSEEPAATVTSPHPPPWATAAAADVAYCLIFTTDNPTENRPSVWLTGTQGTSLARLLSVYGDSTAGDKGSSWAVTAGQRCFWLNGDRTGNIGLPYAINLVAGGDDGWSFDRVDVLVFTKHPGATWKGLNTAGVLPHGNAPGVDLASAWSKGFADVLVTEPEHLVFRHRRCLSSKRYVSGSEIYVPEVSITADGWGSWGDSDWLSELVMVGTQVAVTDNRWSTESIPRSVEYSESVSTEAVRRSLNLRERSTTKSVGITVGVERSGQASAKAPVPGAEIGVTSGWKVSGEFKWSRVTRSIDRTEREESEAGRQGHGEVHTLKYEVPAGCVTFFSVRTIARVERLPDRFHGVEIVRADDGMVETVVERHDFRVHAESGTLREYGPTYSQAGEATFRWGLSIADYPTFERALAH